jgi:hypothetical protein
MRTKFASAIAAVTLSATMAGGLMLATAVPAYAEAKFSVESTPIEDLDANPATKAIVDKYLPGHEDHPMYAQFKGLTLRALSGYAESGLTEEKLKAIQAELDAVK